VAFPAKSSLGPFLGDGMTQMSLRLVLPCFRDLDSQPVETLRARQAMHAPTCRVTYERSFSRCTGMLRAFFIYLRNGSLRLPVPTCGDQSRSKTLSLNPSARRCGVVIARLQVDLANQMAVFKVKWLEEAQLKRYSST
jgi:hypothetical protein